MKTGIIAVLTLALILSACSASSSTTDTDKKESKKEKSAAEFEKIATLIESGSYQYTVRTATPSGGKTIQISSLYLLKAKEGNFEAYLPYYGRSYSGTYGDGGGVEFNGEPEDLEITRRSNNKNIAVQFKIKNGTDQYEVNLDVGSSGYGNLVISNPKKQPISYYGIISALED